MAEPIAEHLNRLSALRAQVETLAEEKEAARRRLIPPEIQAQLDTLDQEFAETGKDLNEQIAVTEGTIITGCEF
jgi:hypothetical protein